MSESGTYTPESLSDPLTITVTTAEPAIAFYIALDNMSGTDALLVTSEIDGGGTRSKTYTVADITADDTSLNSIWYAIEAGQSFTLTLQQTAGTLRTWPYTVAFSTP
jgi:hypothetical protein